MNKTVFAIQIENANDSGLVSLKKDIANNSNLNVYEKDKVFLAYPLNQDLTELLSTDGFEMGLESTFLRILSFDTDTHEYHVDSSLLKQLDEETDIEVEDETISMQDVDNVLDFITENEIEPESKGRDSPTATPSNDQKTDNGNDSESDDDTEESSGDETTGFDNSEIENEFNESGESDSEFDDVSADESKEINNDSRNEANDPEPSEEQIKSPDNHLKDDVGALFKDAFKNNTSDSTNSMVDVAEDLFNSQEITTIPELNSDAPDSIKEIITKVQNNIYQKKDETISDISRKLTNAIKNEEQKLANNQFKEAEENHQKTLRAISSNSSTKKADSEKKRKQEYANKKEEYVQAQLSQLRQTYDNQHQSELNELISEDYRQILEEADISSDQENKQHSDYLENAQQTAFKKVLRTLNIESEILSFRKFVKVQIDSINSYTNEFNEYQKSMQKELDKKDSALDLLRKTSKEQSQLKIDQNNAKYSIKIQKLTDSLSRTEKELDKQRQKNELLKEIHVNNPETVQIKPSNPERTNPSETQEITGEILKEKVKTDKGINWWIPTSVVTGVIAFIAILFGMIMALRPVTAPQSIVQPQTQQVQSSNSDKSSTPSKTLKKGDSFVYTKADGTQVKVIVDSSNSGHYIDDDGNSQTVTF